MYEIILEQLICNNIYTHTKFKNYYKRLLAENEMLGNCFIKLYLFKRKFSKNSLQYQ